MKRFSFRLDRVLRLRDRLRERRRQAYFEAVGYQRRVEHQIAQLGAVRSVEKSQLRDEIARAEVALDYIIRAWAFDHRLAGMARQLGEQLERVEKVVALRQEQLVEAERDVKVLENLEDRLRRRYDEALDHAEREFLDEVANRQWFMARRTG
jgi:flagellar export protein FliJ